jgi:hypothetical protein
MIPGDPEAIAYESLQGLARASDLVLVGRVSELVAGPTVEDPYGNMIYWATTKLRVDEVLIGDLRTEESGTVAVWMLLGVGDKTHDFAERYSQLAASLPSDRVVLFLSNNEEWAKQYGTPLDSPEADPMGYRILGGQGYLRELNDKVKIPARPVGDWPRSLDGTDFEELLDDIRAM